MIVSRHVIFDETNFPFSATKSSAEALDFLLQDRRHVSPSPPTTSEPSQAPVAGRDLVDTLEDDPAIL